MTEHLIAYTSIASYHKSVLDGTVTAQHGTIMAMLYLYWPHDRNRRQISEQTGLKINAVTGRVNTLIKSGLVEVMSESLDVVTSRKVEYVRAIMPAPEQASFEDWRNL